MDFKTVETWIPSTNGSTNLYTLVCIPAGPIRAIVQVVHGMCEYIGRYRPFFEFLASRGFLVVGHDHLGHGRTCTSPALKGYFGPEKGWKALVEDVRRVNATIKDQFPGLPCFLFGHSMGSLVSRLYLIRYPETLDGCILCGTAGPHPASGAGLALLKTILTTKGPLSRPRTVDKLIFGSYNRRIKPQRTPKDWLSRNEESVDRYLADPDCMFLFTAAGYRDLLTLQREANSSFWFQSLCITLPVLLLAGEEQHRQGDAEALEPEGGVCLPLEGQQVAVAGGGKEEHAVGVRQVAVHRFLVAGQPVLGGALGLDAAVVAAEDQLIHRAGAGKGPLGGKDGLEQGQARAGSRVGACGAAEDAAVQRFGVADQVKAGHQRTHAVPEEEAGQAGELVLDGGVDPADVLHQGFPALFWAEVPLEGRGGAGAAVAQVVMAHHQKAPAGQELKEGAVAADIFAHTVDHLHDGPDGAGGDADQRIKVGAAVGAGDPGFNRFKIHRRDSPFAAGPAKAGRKVSGQPGREPGHGKRCGRRLRPGCRRHPR